MLLKPGLKIVLVLADGSKFHDGYYKPVCIYITIGMTAVCFIGCELFEFQIPSELTLLTAIWVNNLVFGFMIYWYSKGYRIHYEKPKEQLEKLQREASITESVFEEARLTSLPV